MTDTLSNNAAACTHFPVGANMSAVDLETLQHHYESVPSAVGFARKCSMNLPEGLESMRILDLGCRRGKGVMKLAERAGVDGYVLGVDWIPDHVESARQYALGHSHDMATCAPCEFRLGYPEALDVAGVGEESFDAVFVNCSMNLFFDLDVALAYISRALRPGGMLMVDGVFSNAPRDPAVMEQARQLDNSVQSAPYLQEFLRQLGASGFQIRELEAGEPVAPDVGFTQETSVTCVNAVENLEFATYAIRAYKRIP